MNKNNYNFISMDVVASRITKHPLLKDINYEDIIAYTVDVLRLINMPRSYEEDSFYAEVIERKAKLPSDNLNVKTVDYIVNGQAYPMVIATDSLHNQIHKLKEKRRNESAYTYSLNAGLIHCNQEDGVVFVTYDKLKCGEDGYPMIPDSVNVRLAIENYIKKEIFGVFFDLGKIPERSVQKAETDYDWYIGKAQTEFQGFINDDDMESFLRDFKRLFIQNSTHKDRHMHNMLREKRYKH